MVEVNDYQFAYFNSLMYDQKPPNGPVSGFSIYEESDEYDSGMQATLFTQEGQVHVLRFACIYQNVTIAL